MSDIRTVIITADSVDRNGPAWAAASQGAVFPEFSFGEPPDSHVSGGIRSATGAEEALEMLGEGSLLVKVRLGTGGTKSLAGQDSGVGQEALGRAVSALSEKSPLKTVFTLIAPGTLAFWGHGIAMGVTGTTVATGLDVLPTLAMVGEFLLAPGVDGRVLFQALRNPSYKQAQIGRLKAALARLEKVLKRTDQEPWDKHDCA
ncbi:MAG: hypothetical protein LBT40_01380 [Deltaproteobacteria bacterium]|jgi:hypothetical protein|nr:hypothetical protein [Deltaproteobacteria bacterium]